MQDIVDLMQEAQQRINTYDPVFIDKTERVLGVLRSKGVVSYKRISQNGKFHTLLAATLVLMRSKRLYATNKEAEGYVMRYDQLVLCVP